MNEDPSAFTLAESAVAIHEMHESLRKAGFSRWAALWLTGCALKGVPLPDWFADRLREAGDDA